MLQVFECIFGLLLVPDADDALDSNLALLFFEDKEKYEAAVVGASQKARDQTRHDLKQSLIDE